MIVEFLVVDPKLQGIAPPRPLVQVDMADVPLPQELFTDGRDGMVYQVAGRGWMIEQRPVPGVEGATALVSKAVVALVLQGKSASLQQAAIATRDPKS